MNRMTGNKTPYVKPVKKIELEDKVNVKRRIIFVALFVIIAGISIAWGVNGLLSAESGWTQVKVEGATGNHSGNDFAFYYNLGQEELDASVELKNLKNEYAVLAVESYQIFDANEEISGVRNLCFINAHPNEEIEVSAGLYKAFEKIQANKDFRNIYLGPVVEVYNGLFFCEDASQTANYDGYTNPENAQFYKEVAAFAANSEAVDIKLLGDNKVMLYVSEDYLKYAQENSITKYIDLSWMKNAFIADYIADTLMEKGYCHGVLSSYDGFTRSFTKDDEESQSVINCLYDNHVLPAAAIKYTGSLSMVEMRAYGRTENDRFSYYAFSNGEVRTLYLDTEDGLCKGACNELIMLSKEKSCTDILFNMIPIYISDSLNQSLIEENAQNGIYSVFVEANVVKYNGDVISLVDMYDKDGIRFSSQYME